MKNNKHEKKVTCVLHCDGEERLSSQEAMKPCHVTCVTKRYSLAEGMHMCPNLNSANSMHEVDGSKTTSQGMKKQ